MKNFAKLTLFFTSCFLLLFVISVSLGLLSSWIDRARIIAPEAGLGKDAAELAWRALPAALYVSILLALSYAARRQISIPSTVICVFVLGSAFTLGASLGISRAEILKPALAPGSPIRGEPGLILSRSDTAMVLLKGDGDIRGPRVVSLPGKPLMYQEAPRGPNNTVPALPALAFSGDTPWFIRSLDIDFFLCAAELKGRLEESFLSFAAYAFSLVLLLSFLRFILELSQWPLANLFLGALVFRLILSLGTFLDTREINSLLGSFLKDQAPPALITPLVFGSLGVLLFLYTLLSGIARGKNSGPGRNGDD